MYFLNKMISTIISLSVFFFLGTCDNTSMSKKQIYKYVSENKFELDKTLNEYALENEDGNINISDLNIPYSKGIQNANVVFYTGKSTEKPFKIFEFDCGGKGMGSQTSYWGFYYVASEHSLNPNELIQNADRGILGYQHIDFVAEDNGWIWREEGGDNIVYIENITGNFYYWLEEF